MDDGHHSSEQAGANPASKVYPIIVKLIADFVFEVAGEFFFITFKTDHFASHSIHVRTSRLYITIPSRYIHEAVPLDIYQ